jgi:hypothetical protein
MSTLTATQIQTKIDAISTTLDTLYSKTAKDMSLESRKIVLQDIDKLEASLDKWEGRLAAMQKTKPRVASINLEAPGAGL